MQQDVICNKCEMSRQNSSVTFNFPSFRAAAHFKQRQQHKTRLRVKPGSLEWRLSNKHLANDVMKVDEKGLKYSLDSEQGLQPLNEYDLWVLPTIPWALILPPQKKSDSV